MYIRRVRVERDPSADTDLQGALTRAEGQLLDHFTLMVHEHASEDVVIEMCEIGVNPAFVRLGHQFTPFPRK
jgi:hypothetical protein